MLKPVPFIKRTNGTRLLWRALNAREGYSHASLFSQSTSKYRMTQLFMSHELWKVRSNVWNPPLEGESKVSYVNALAGLHTSPPIFQNTYKGSLTSLLGWSMGKKRSQTRILKQQKREVPLPSLFRA